MRHLWMAAAAGIMTLAGATAATAQPTCATNPCTVTSTASVTVPVVLRLTVSSATTSLTAPDEAAYTTGHVDDAGPTASVKSNAPWKVNVIGAAANFTAAGGANPSKAASDLTWGTSAGTYPNNMGATATLMSGTNGTGNASQAIFFRTNWNWASDTPGDYSLTINFTLSSP